MLAHPISPPFGARPHSRRLRCCACIQQPASLTSPSGTCSAECSRRRALAALATATAATPLAFAAAPVAAAAAAAAEALEPPPRSWLAAAATVYDRPGPFVRLVKTAPLAFDLPSSVAGVAVTATLTAPERDRTGGGGGDDDAGGDIDGERGTTKCLVVWSSGFVVPSSNYASYAAALASYGCVVRVAMIACARARERECVFVLFRNAPAHTSS